MKVNRDTTILGVEFRDIPKGKCFLINRFIATDEEHACIKLPNIVEGGFKYNALDLVTEEFTYLTDEEICTAVEAEITLKSFVCI